MTANLNEARAWTRSDSGNPDVSAAERDAFGTASTLPPVSERIRPDAHGRIRRPDRLRDAMLTREDATAERGSKAERIIGAIASVAVGVAFLAMVALTLWGWTS